MPYAIEKFNFNPFDMQGDYSFEDVNDPLSFKRETKTTEDGEQIELDDLKRTINPQGFLCDENGSLLRRDGRMLFDWRQFSAHGGLIPKLYNYSGKTFEIHDVMGIFDRDETG